MALNLENKKAIVAELTQVAGSAISVVAADYRGLTVSVMNALRKSARRSGVAVGVYRNTLARRALKDTEFACLSDVLTGPIVLFFAHSDPGAAARVIRDFEFADKLSVRGLALGGKLLPATDLKAVASLPTLHEALCQLVSVMNAPITKFVRTLNEPTAQMVRAFAAVGDQKKAA
ncbi:MAG: 50S ribosomal protein L10 [Gammaproteobacteria bacterium]|nr:50S ribosomal protein L10 [Gammaproteobacteria bacterium]